jgi:hypothetical protein
MDINAIRVEETGPDVWQWALYDRLLLRLPTNGVGQPLEALKEPLSGGGTTVDSVSIVKDRNRMESTDLGCTYQSLSRIRCRPSFSVTSAGDIAIGFTRMSHAASIRTRRGGRGAYRQVNLACWQRREASSPSFLGH